MRVSDYNIYLPFMDDKYIFVQGLTGAFDLVEENIYKQLLEATSDRSKIESLDEKIKEQLLKRGYLTNRTNEEEQMILGKLTEKINEKNQNNINVTFIPTYNCNFRCVYCFEKKLEEKGKEWMTMKMDTKTIDATYKQIDKWIEEGKKVTNITLFGGEPLLYPNYEIVKYIVENAKKRNLSVAAISNGYSLEKFEDLLGKDGIEYIQVTLDGLKEFHDKRRFLVGNQPTFDKICKNIDLALKKGTVINLRSNINKENFEVIDELIELYNQNKWTSYPNFKYYFKATHKCYEKKANIVKDIEIMKELGNKFGDVSKFNFNSIYNSLSNSIKNMFEKGGYAPIKGGYCGANGGMYTIDPLGDVYACWDVLGNEEQIIGKLNIEKGKIEFNNKSDYWKNRTVNKIEACSKCKYSLFCGGGCAAHAGIVNGNMYSPYCEDFKTIFEEVVPTIFKEVYSKEAN